MVQPGHLCPALWLLEFQEHEPGPHVKCGTLWLLPRCEGPAEKVQCCLFGNARKEGEEGGGWRVSRLGWA